MTVEFMPLCPARWEIHPEIISALLDISVSSGAVLTVIFVGRGRKGRNCMR